MSDREFVEMGPAPALEYWRNASTPQERERLHALYASKRGISLSQMAARPDGAVVQVENAPVERGGMTLQDMGLALMVVGFIGAVIGWMTSTPIFWLLAVGSLGMTAGFFCALFGWIGKKLDLIAERLKD